jgi:hypothetical protein
MTSKSGWKGLERRVAKRVGGQRIAVTGERAGEDVRQQDAFGYQVKLGRSMPAYLWDWLQGIRGSAAQHGRIGVVVWKPKHKRDEDAVVILTFKDWCSLHSSQQVDAELHRSVVGDDED